MSAEPDWLESSLDHYYAWGLVFLFALVLGFALYKVREPALRRAALQEQERSYVKVGATLFQQHCTACHGPAGTGGSVAPTLYSSQFLENTSDTQIGWLITGGISGTTMSAYGLDLGGPLTLEQVRQLVVYIRSWEATAPSLAAWRTGAKVETAAPVPPEPPPRMAEQEKQPAGDAARIGRGRTLYGQYCIACHGVDGVGGIGSTLNAKEYLAGTTDDRMRQAIVHGVPGTSMSPWGAAAGGPLPPPDVDALIAYLRSWTPTAPSVPGWKKGRPPGASLE